MDGSMHRADTDFRVLMVPRLFQHRQLLNLSKTDRILSRVELTNVINYCHFMNRPAFALLQHQHHDEYVITRVRPEPCLGAELTCRWETSCARPPADSYQLSRLFIPHDQFVVAVSLQGARSVNGAFSLPLPEESYALNQRRFPRFSCRDVSAELVQNGAHAYGELVDLGSRAFRISTRPEAKKIKSWFNPDVPASVRLFSGREDVFYGSCRYVRRQDNPQSEDIVLSAENDHINRFKPKKIRNPRRRLSPPPAAVFTHPFLQKRIHRDIYDLSTTGFSVRDDADEAVLMPGMMVTGLSIVHAGIRIAQCTAQIIYRRVETGTVLYGIAILDMDIHSYSRIHQLLSAHADPHISVSTEVDMDALWEFFFQAGFIYPAKYGFFQPYRESCLDTYRKLYQENPDVARHITYQEAGKIYGHMSMVRAYERAWLIQHHAARPMENRIPGYIVLRHMILFLHGAYTLPSAKMDYVMCFFRPENKFPERVFGGFARDLKNPRGCSLDIFAYLTVASGGGSVPLPESWSLRRAALSELWELTHFYRRMSGGLFLDVLNAPSAPGGESLQEVSERHGLMRQWSIYALMYEDRLAGVMVVNQSDFGVNLSEILNSITVMVIEPGLLTKEVLLTAVSQLAAIYSMDKVPLLIYPDDYAASHGVPAEKRYSMWIVDMHHSNLFLEFMQRKFRMKYE